MFAEQLVLTETRLRLMKRWTWGSILKWKHTSKPRKWFLSLLLTPLTHVNSPIAGIRDVLIPWGTQYVDTCNRTALHLGLFVFHHFITLSISESLAVLFLGCFPYPPYCTQPMLIYYIILPLRHKTVLVTTGNILTEVLRRWTVERGAFPMQRVIQQNPVFPLSAHVNSRYFPRRSWGSLFQ